MSIINKITILAYIKASMAADKAKAAVKDFNSDERGVEGFVVALILIGIAAILAIIFKDAILELMDSLINKIKELLELDD